MISSVAELLASILLHTGVETLRSVSPFRTARATWFPSYTSLRLGNTFTQTGVIIWAQCLAAARLPFTFERSTRTDGLRTLTPSANGYRLSMLICMLYS